MPYTQLNLPRLVLRILDKLNALPHGMTGTDQDKQQKVSAVVMANLKLNPLSGLTLVNLEAATAILREAYPKKKKCQIMATGGVYARLIMAISAPEVAAALVSYNQRGGADYRSEVELSKSQGIIVRGQNLPT